jgi:alpha-ribazole phosphatase
MQRIVQGHQPGTLSPSGHQQASLLAQRLQSVNFTGIYCSDLQRCRDTLQYTLQYHSYIPPVYDTRLREKSSGIFEGKPVGLADQEAERLYLSKYEYRPPEGENWNDVRERAFSFLNDIVRNHMNSPGQRVLVVSHSGWIVVFLNILREIIGLDRQIVRTKNTALYIFKISQKECGLWVDTLLENDASHLENIVKAQEDGFEVK